MGFAKLIDVSGYLPESILDNHALSKEHPEWSVDKIYAKTGIFKRHIAACDETALDLGEQACKKLIDKNNLALNNIECLIFCTQSPDYALPSNSSLLQKRLGLPETIMAFDIQHGCSGFTYGVALAKSLIESGQVRNALLVTAETYSKYLSPTDYSVRTIFGDAGASAFFEVQNSKKEFISNFVFNTNGAGASNLIVPESGRKASFIDADLKKKCLHDNLRSLSDLYMNGPEIFLFTLDAVPKLFSKILSKEDLAIDDIDLFVFHQANKFMLENIARKCSIPVDKLYVFLEDVGNTVSCSIPLALEDAKSKGRIGPASKIMILGFGVGYSSAGGIIQL